MLETAIRSILRSNATILAACAERVRPFQGAQNDAHPFITISVDDVPGRTHSGSTGSSKATVEIGIVAATYGQCDDLASACRTALHCYVGTQNGERIQPALFDEESDTETQTPDGSDTPLYVRTQTYVVCHQPVS